MEIIDIYDENLTPLGSVSRDDAHQNGQWHRTIHAWIVRPHKRGYVLFQKRGKHKKLFPDVLDISAAGHYMTGETYKEGVREITEEIGLNVTEKDLISLGIKMDVAKVGSVTNREFSDVFLLARDEAPNEYKIDENEVEGLVQIKIQDGLDLFSGRKTEIWAEGVEWSRESNTWQPIKIKVNKEKFIPRIDPYYYKIFIIAKAYLKGEKDLSI
jgi:isopentenyldiphosphate isomerase